MLTPMFVVSKARMANLEVYKMLLSLTIAFTQHTKFEVDGFQYHFRHVSLGVDSAIIGRNNYT